MYNISDEKPHSTPIFTTKYLNIALAVGLILTIIAGQFTAFATDCKQIRENTLRLHIIANSDSKADQQLKLDIRDQLLSECAVDLGNASSKTQAVDVAADTLDTIKAVASDVIKRSGYDYTVDAYVCEMFFETRVYEDFTLPAGRYDAVRVTIGAANGKNWWCVLYPALCLPAATKSDKGYSEHQRDIVKSDKKYELRFWVVEIFEKIKNNVSYSNLACANLFLVF